MTLALRPYQSAALAAIRRHLAGPPGDGVVVMPTGSGKTVVFAALVREWLDGVAEPPRVLILAHRYELLEQAAAKLRRAWPDAPVGLWSAGLGRREGDRPVVVAGIQSVAERLAELGAFEHVIVDEAHLVSTDPDSTYRRVLDSLRAQRPDLRVLGFTATPYRLDGGLIYGENRPFARLVFEVGIAELIRDGYLAPIRTKEAAAQPDLAGVARRGGDYVAADLERAVAGDDLVRAAVAELLRVVADRRSVLVFACGVEHARRVADELELHGERVAVVLGSTPLQERAGILARFDAGALRFLVNVECLTTGLDVERVDAIACLRPTMSTGLWVQMIGRGLRPHAGKRDLLVADFTSNSATHGPLDRLDVQVARRAAGASTSSPTATSKACPRCRELVTLATRRCPDCGHAWPPPGPTHNAVASSLPLLGYRAGVGYPVRAVTARLHARTGKPRMLRVAYDLGETWVAEFVLLEHAGFARMNAARWWARRFGYPVPKTVAQALATPDLEARLLEVTDRIKLDPARDFPVVGHVLREPVAATSHNRRGR